MDNYNGKSLEDHLNAIQHLPATAVRSAELEKAIETAKPESSNEEVPPSVFRSQEYQNSAK